jgi:hypothetical protein
MQARYEMVSQVIPILTRKLNTFVFSPIAYWHPIAVAHSLPRDALFWQTMNEAVMAVSSDFGLLKLPGWYESAGISMEIDWCCKRGHPITFYTHSELLDTWAQSEITTVLGGYYGIGICESCWL